MLMENINLSLSYKDKLIFYKVIKGGGGKAVTGGHWKELTCNINNR